MIKTHPFLFPLLMLAASGVHAGPYKCTGADGRVSFQEQPCQAGTTGSTMTIRPQGREAEPAAAQPQAGQRPSAAQRHLDKAREANQQDAIARHNQQIDAQNKQVEARNKEIRCSAARRNLSVLQEERPVVKYDSKGQKQYVEDAKRPAEIAAVQRSVADNCN